MKDSTIGLLANGIGLIASLILAIVSMTKGDEITLILFSITTLILATLLTTWKD